MAEYLNVPVDRIRCDAQQVRQTFREESIANLAQSLKEVGMLHPVLVTPEQDGHYRLISGERRLRAAIQAGEQTVPALVVRELRGNVTQIQLIENLQREDLNPVERALAIQAFMAQEKLSKAAAGARLGIPRTTLTDWLDVLDLDPRYQAALVDNFQGGDSPLTLSHVSEAKALAARLGSPQIASVLLDAVLERRLSKAETRQVAQLVREGGNISIMRAVRMVRAMTDGANQQAAAAEENPGAGALDGEAAASGQAKAGRPGRFERLIRSLDRVRRVLAALVGGALRHMTPEERGQLLDYLQSMRRWIDDAITFTREIDDPELAEQRREAMRRAARKASKRKKGKKRPASRITPA